eukprot:Opistho-2@15452
MQIGVSTFAGGKIRNEIWGSRLCQSAPIDAFKEWMCLECSKSAVIFGTESLVGIEYQQLFDEVLSGRWKSIGNGILELCDLLEDLVFVSGAKRRPPREQLVDDAPERPQIGRLTSALLCQQFGRNVLCSAHKRIGFRPLVGRRRRFGRSGLRKNFCGSKVGDLNVHRPIKKDVLWLEVAVNDAQAMHMFKGQNDFRSIVLRALFVKGSQLLDEIEKLAVLRVRQHKVKLLCILKGVVETHEERVIQCVENELFRVDILDLVLLNNVLLFENFDGKLLSRCNFLGENDGRIRALAKCIPKSKVHGCPLSCGACIASLFSVSLCIRHIRTVFGAQDPKHTLSSFFSAIECEILDTAER